MITPRGPRPYVPSIQPIAYTQRGGAVAGFGQVAIDPGTGSMIVEVPSRARAYGAMATFAGLTLVGAAAGAAVSGKKAGRGRNAVGAGVGAALGMVLGYFGAKMIVG